MQEKITWVKNTLPKETKTAEYARSMGYMTTDEARKVNRFHMSIPRYEPTPLVSLPALAARLGIKALFVKDESKRFGLNSFKVLGGSWAMANYIAGKLGLDPARLTYEALTSAETKARLGQVTFYSTTDGNHGRGVAWSAKRLGQKCVIYMPKGSSRSRLENIRAEGAEATITDMNYDDAVRYAASQVKKDFSGVLVQDTDWPGYEDIPAWIMQGYGTVSFEAHNQLLAAGVARPTHIFGQAGVGSFDGSLHGYFANAYKDDPPLMTTVESSAADCLARSAAAGRLTAVGGDMPTIMAGLACGEACGISWQILKNHSSFFVSIPDWVTAKAMRTLGAPLPGDERVISGESGASTTGLVLSVLQYAEYAGLKEALGLDGNSVVLTVSTEGDTYPEQYERIVWDGEYASR
jgi:diaminopropionate ammonia-lyase